MGLAAGQARLLFLTSRKSDVEFGSMRIANQKLSLARDLSEISDSYSRDLNKRKLVWSMDNDPTSANTVDVSYDILMKPNNINPIPYLVTDPYKRVVLDDQYADAMDSINGNLDDRDGFIKFLMKGVPDFDISKYPKQITAKDVKPSGDGGDELVGKPEKLSDILAMGKLSAQNIDNGNGDSLWAKGNETWADLYNGGKKIPVSWTTSGDGYRDETGSNIEGVVRDFASDMSKMLTDSGALSFATSQTLNQFKNINKHEDDHSAEYMANGHSDELATIHTRTEWSKDRMVSIDVKNLVDTFMTYYQIALDGGPNDSLYAVKSHRSNSKLIDGATLMFDTMPGSVTKPVNPNDPPKNPNEGANREKVNYYDLVLEGIQQKKAQGGGWVRDNSITNKDYLQNGVRNNKFQIEQLSSSGYWTAEAFGTNTQMRDVPDTEGRAAAQSKYETQKNKLNEKEKQLDVQLKNLDTERAALDTEIDSVKTIINKNIERSFKMFQA